MLSEPHLPHRGVLVHLVDHDPVLRAMAWGIGWGVTVGGEAAAAGFRYSAGARDLTARCLAASGRIEGRAATEVTTWAHAHHSAHLR